MLTMCHEQAVVCPDPWLSFLSTGDKYLTNRTDLGSYSLTVWLGLEPASGCVSGSLCWGLGERGAEPCWRREFGLLKTDGCFYRMDWAWGPWGRQHWGTAALAWLRMALGQQWGG